MYRNPCRILLISHSLRYFNSQQPHAGFDDVGDGFGEDEAENFQIGIFFAEYGEIVVELVVFFYQLVDVVGYQRGTELVAGFFYNLRKFS